MQKTLSGATLAEGCDPGFAHAQPQMESVEFFFLGIYSPILSENLRNQAMITLDFEHTKFHWKEREWCLFKNIHLTNNKNTKCTKYANYSTLLQSCQPADLKFEFF